MHWPTLSGISIELSQKERTSFFGNLLTTWMLRANAEYCQCLARGVGAAPRRNRERTARTFAYRNKGSANAVEVMRLEVHSEAREEFLQAVSFYQLRCRAWVPRFITEIDRCQKALLEIPLIGHPYGRRLRKFTVGDKFPFSIVYAVLGRFYLYWRTLMVATPRLLAVRVHPLTIGSSDRGVAVFGGPRSGSMLGIKCLCLTPVKPRVAQPYR